MTLLAALVATSRELGANASRLAKVRALAAFLRRLDPDELETAVLYLAGETPQARSGIVQRDQEIYDSLGRRRVIPTRTYQERKGFRLRPRFIFIDGRTGATLYSEKFREEVLYNAQQNTPALSSYFELMDKLLPSFLNTLSTQKIRGSRTLLK